MSRAYQTEPEARGDDRNQHGGRETRKDDERSAPRRTPHTRGHHGGVRMDQYLVFEDVVRRVDAYKQACIKHDGRRRKLGRCYPRCRDGQQRDQEEMNEVDPYHRQRRRTDEPTNRRTASDDGE